MVHLKIQGLNDEVCSMYAAHGNFHPGDSGLDLFVVADQEICAGKTEFIRLGFKASAWNDEKTRNVSWLIMPRSSICKTPLRLANSVGLIDAGYRGEVMAAVDNIKDYDYKVKKGDRLVQAVAFNGESLTYEIVKELDCTSRGEGGFGSTTNNEEMKEMQPKKQKIEEMTTDSSAESVVDTPVLTSVN